MTEEERKARQWLEVLLDDLHGDAAKHANTILQLLDRPVMPKGSEVPDEVLSEMVKAFRRSCMIDAVDVLYDHLTAPPKPKKVEAWAVVDEKGNVHALTTDKYKAWDIADRNHYSAVRLGVEADNE